MSERSTLGKSVIATAIAGAVGTIIGWATRGSSGATGALVATVLVLVFFWVGQVVLMRTIQRNPALATSVAMALYLVKIAVLFVLLLAFADTTLFDTKVFAATLVVATVVWLVTEVIGFATSKVPYVTPGETPDFLPPRD